MKPNTDHLLPLLANRIDYDPITGVFMWKKYVPDQCGWWNSKYAGTPAGGVASKGYLVISITDAGRVRRVVAHRLAFYISNGRPPACQIDHINGDRLDNRMANLREVTHAENMLNQGPRKNNKSGVVGVSWSKAGGKWQANGPRQYIGTFSTFELAVAAATEHRVALGFSDRHVYARPAKESP